MNITRSGLTTAAGAAPRSPAPSSSPSRSTTRPHDVVPTETTDVGGRAAAPRPRWRCWRSSASPACTCASTAKAGAARARRLPAVRRRLPRDVRRRRSSPPPSCPAVVDTDPDYVNDVVAAAVGGTPAGDIGGAADPVQRHRRRLHRSAACSSASPCSAPASSPAGPPPCSPSAPSRHGSRSRCCRSRSAGRSPCRTGIALIGLGVSLWRTSRVDPTAEHALDRADRSHR